MFLSLTSKDTNRILHDCKYFEYDNIVSTRYFACEGRFQVEIQDEILQDNTKTQSYFICEAPHSIAFAHWVCEFFFPSLPLLLHFKNDPTMIFVLFENTRRFAINFLLRLGIPKTQMIIASNENAHIHGTEKQVRFLNTVNRVIFPPLFCLNDSNATYEEWEKTFLYPRVYLPKSTSKIPYVFLLRSVKDNYTERPSRNDRENLENWVIEHDGMILDTYYLNNISQQEWIIRNAKVIITNSGSSYIVNGIFAQNSDIFVLDDIGLSFQINSYSAMNAVDTFIRKQNRVEVYPSFSSILSRLE